MNRTVDSSWAKTATRLEAISDSKKDCFNATNQGINSNEKLLGAKGIATRSKDATRGSWPY